MIKMIIGVYGHYSGSGVEPKDKNSPPFELSAEEEAQLVEQGVAVYVDGGRTALPAGVGTISQYNESSSVSELREIGKTLGLTFKVGMKKTDMIAALDAHIAENTDDDAESDDGNDGAESGGESEPPTGENDENKDNPPSFDPSQAVQ